MSKLFAEHASPEAIRARMADLRSRQQQIQQELGWLERLYIRRTAEKAAGAWPAAGLEREANK